MNKYIYVTPLFFIIQACASIPEQYREDCADGACKHMELRCKQLKLEGTPTRQYSVNAIKDYQGDAETDGQWLVRCRKGKIVKIMDSKYKDIAKQ